MDNFKANWLEARLIEAFGNPEQYDMATTHLIFEHCMAWLQPVNLDENTPHDVQDRICDKMLENLTRHLQTVNLMSHITVIRNNTETE